VSAPSIVRALVVVTAVCAAVVLVALQRSEERCTDSVKEMFFALRERAPEPRLNATVADIEDDCPGSSRLVDSGAVLFQEGYPEQAAGILRVAVDREPESFSAWAGLASVLAETDPAGASEAAARARKLNSFYRPPS
jgi:hypothetical protein